MNPQNETGSSLQNPLAELEAIVYVIDDDVSVRESLHLLLEMQGWRVELCSSADEFLNRERVAVPRCLVLDVAMPGLSGLELQERITSEYPATPIVFITGHGDIPMTVRAMKAGAVEFLTKPLRAEDVVRAIHEALRKCRVMLSRDADQRVLRVRYERLTQREREVMALVVSGLANKQVAAELGISEITVKRHRGSAMQKMNAASLPDLVKMSGRLRLSRPQTGHTAVSATGQIAQHLER